MKSNSTGAMEGGNEAVKDQDKEETQKEIRQQEVGGKHQLLSPVLFHILICLSLSHSLSFRLAIFPFPPSISLHPSHDWDTVLCGCTARMYVYVCVCVWACVAVRGMVISVLMLRAACWVSVCPFVPAQPRCKSVQGSGSKGWAGYIYCSQHMHMHKKEFHIINTLASFIIGFQLMCSLHHSCTRTRIFQPNQLCRVFQDVARGGSYCIFHVALFLLYSRWLYCDTDECTLLPQYNKCQKFRIKK